MDQQGRAGAKVAAAAAEDGRSNVRVAQRSPLPVREDAFVKVVESCSIARSEGAVNFDRLVTTPHVAAVIDGTTGKPWHSAQMSGGGVADEIAALLAGLDGTEAPEDVVLQLTAAVAKTKAAARSSNLPGSAATMAAVLVDSRVVLRVGDPWVRIGAQLHPPRLRAERATAGARALMAAHAMSRGVPVARLRADDIAREAVLPLLRAADELRNHPTSEWGYGAIDGGEVPTRFIERWTLPDEAVQVTLASDGFPWVGLDLTASEAALRTRLERDPLMIEEPPATKGSPAPEASFDDRTFLRVEVPAP